MTLLVKICGLSQVEHVDAAIDAGADALGFVFAKSVREVTPQQAARLTASVPSSVKRVAVMLHPSNEDWQQVLKTFSPDVLQHQAECRHPVRIRRPEKWPGRDG
jgi:phosphoribosylanthranilate isomerase